MAAIQTYAYPIRSYHTNAHGRVFIHQLLNFFQDAAHNHADGLGFGQMQLVDDKLFWVLSRLSIEIDRLPKAGESIQLATWVKSIRGAVSEREFSVAINDQSLVRASSLWFCLSGETHKPAKLPEMYSERMDTHDEYATAGGPEKVEPAMAGLQWTKTQTTKATYSDIDMANHVNNATYVRWLIDGLPAEYHQHKDLSKLDINYLGECFLGEQIAVFQIKDQHKLIQEVRIPATDKVICRANLRWL